MREIRGFGMDIAEISENVKRINAYIKECEEKTGRKIFLVGATKTRTIAEINAGIEAGLSIVGENRPQEFRDKFSLISPLAEKHFIGHLQANKVKYVVGKASLIHSCDSLETARAISAYAKKTGIVQDVLIEINIAGEADKHGFAPEGLNSASESLKTIDNLRFRGLMTVLPHIEKSLLPPYLKKMKNLFDALKESVFGEEFEYLSMGMSEDYEISIEYGANMIRLGRAIFGEREV